MIRRKIDQDIKVMSYSGYRGEENPRTFILQNKKIEILYILKSWIEEDYLSRERKRFFRIEGSDGLEHTIYYDEESMDWFYRIEK